MSTNDISDEENEADMQEPSEEGLVNMKIVKMLKVLVEEQYIAMALLADGLLHCQQYLLSSSSPLTRRVGLELLSALCHDSSPAGDYTYVPDIIDEFKLTVVQMLDDSRALIRALALQWLGGIMVYRHPNGENLARYQPGIDFVTESVDEDKLFAMLKGTRDEAKVAAEIVKLTARYSTQPEVRDSMNMSKELIDLLWNGVFWDEEKVSLR